VQPNSLESRVAALETQVHDLTESREALETQVHDLTERVRASEQDAAAARVLAGAADRDVSEFGAELRDFRQATVASFNALREDFNDLRTHVDQGFIEMRQGFIEMRGKFDATAAGQQQIADLLQTIIRRNDE